MLATPWWIHRLVGSSECSGVTIENERELVA